mmetsp:Transcript_15942/g.53766  ORF Transcript_15942/g.53766 Transcript_15942/m.53766 type:complete len:202 (-) Transcript_15942:940-1545(-)
MSASGAPFGRRGSAPGCAAPTATRGGASPPLRRAPRPRRPASASSRPNAGDVVRALPRPQNVQRRARQRRRKVRPRPCRSRRGLRHLGQMEPSSDPIVISYHPRSRNAFSYSAQSVAVYIPESIPPASPARYSASDAPSIMAWTILRREASGKSVTGEALGEQTTLMLSGPSANAPSSPESGMRKARSFEGIILKTSQAQI